MGVCECTVSAQGQGTQDGNQEGRWWREWRVGMGTGEEMKYEGVGVQEGVNGNGGDGGRRGGGRAPQRLFYG